MRIAVSILVKQTYFETCMMVLVVWLSRLLLYIQYTVGSFARKWKCTSWVIFGSNNLKWVLSVSIRPATILPHITASAQSYEPLFLPPVPSFPKSVVGCLSGLWQTSNVQQCFVGRVMASVMCVLSWSPCLFSVPSSILLLHSSSLPTSLERSHSIESSAFTDNLSCGPMNI